MELLREAKFERRRKARKIGSAILLPIAGVTAIGLIIGSADSQQSTAKATHLSIEEDYLTSLSSLTSHLDTSDSCSEVTPNFGKFESAAIAPGTSSTDMLTSIYSTYGIAVDFVKTPVAESTYYTAEPFTSIDEATKMVDLELIEKGLSNFDLGVIRALKISNIVVAEDLKGNNSAALQEANGLYLSGTPDSEIVIVPNGGDDYVERTIVHEVGHAIDDKLLCGPEDDAHDIEISDLNTIPYDTRDDALATPGHHQEFASDYAETNVLEDRAETLADTIVDRGLILPGDPEWKSPFQKKQMEIVRRLEQLSPGFTKYLINKTLKMKPSNPYNR